MPTQPLSSGVVSDRRGGNALVLDVYTVSVDQVLTLLILFPNLLRPFQKGDVHSK